jgi:hypothetical protein
MDDRVGNRRSEDRVTIGEVYRRLVDMDERYEKKLDRIETQVHETNSRTTTLEGKVRHLERFDAAPALEGESVSVKLSPKVWTAIAGAVGMLLAMFIEWAKRELGQ